MMAALYPVVHRNLDLGSDIVLTRYDSFSGPSLTVGWLRRMVSEQLETLCLQFHVGFEQRTCALCGELDHKLVEVIGR